MKIRILKSLEHKNRKFLKNDEVKIEVDKTNIPTSLFWRQRLNDMQFDNCIEIIKEKLLINKQAEKKWQAQTETQ